MASNLTSRAAASNKALGRADCDELSRIILDMLAEAGEPVETKEIENRAARLAAGVTRIKVLYRLQNLRAECAICGKFIGPGKGVWVWWARQDGGKP